MYVCVYIYIYIVHPPVREPVSEYGACLAPDDDNNCMRKRNYMYINMCIYIERERERCI